MNSTIKKLMLAAVSAAILGGALVGGQQLAMAGTNGNTNSNHSGNAVPLKEAKLIIEHNDKDKDTGFQAFIDSEGWDRVTVTDPNGKQILDFKGQGELGKLGLTELFLESVEPENADVPIDELLKTLPEGEYVFKGSGMESGENTGMTIGRDTLTHDIPKGPELLTPEEDELVPEDEDLLVSWEPVDKTIDGSDVNIIAYQLIVEKDKEDPEPNMIGTFGLSMYLPSDVTEIKVPAAFLEPGTDYVWEVLAIEESGNQSLMSSAFSTSD